ncbi:hypothetical protein [Angustibacter sp. Root456]|uniref:hypothetical protein n=1 Tax=Angustibacter sp. Root456 TaxID=1736539 RepID=UPI0012FBC090|nr:hypothetical protein [Angustibacter sp. Root456]
MLLLVVLVLVVLMLVVLSRRWCAPDGDSARRMLVKGFTSEIPEQRAEDRRCSSLTPRVLAAQGVSVIVL